MKNLTNKAVENFLINYIGHADWYINHLKDTYNPLRLCLSNKELKDCKEYLIKQKNDNAKILSIRNLESMIKAIKNDSWHEGKKRVNKNSTGKFNFDSALVKFAEIGNFNFKSIN